MIPHSCSRASRYPYLRAPKAVDGERKKASVASVTSKTSRPRQFLSNCSWLQKTASPLRILLDGF